MVTLLTEAGEAAVAAGRAEGEQLWLPAADAEAATGWSVEPEGLCRGGVCVPVPPARRADLVRGGEVDVAALWHHLGKPVLRASAGDVWVLGEGAQARGAALRSLEAPDFTLPDAAGRLHSLSDHRGKKILLVSWASW